MIVEIRAFGVRYAHLSSFLLLTKGFAFCYAKTRKLAMSGFSGFRTSLTLIQRRKSPCLSWRWLERLWKNRSAYRAAMPQNKNRLKKMGRV